MRLRVYEPAQQDLLDDYLIERRRFLASPWAIRWLTFCFTVRTADLWWRSLYAWGGSGLVRVLVGLAALILGREALGTLRGLLFRMFR